MVAYTPTLCLPYFEATDSPCLNMGTVCEPQNLWCNMAEIVEANLAANDVIVARTVTAIPLAQVSYVTTTPTVVNGPIPFDVADLDTDDMVNLSVFPGITPRRNGIYGIHAEILLNNVPNDDFPDVRIFIGNEAAPGLGGVDFTGPLRGTTRGFGSDAWVQISGHWPFTDLAPSPREISVVLFLTTAVQEARLSVFWHSDLDS